MKHPITATRLRNAIDDLGITQQALSNKSGVDKTSISQYINGTHIPGNISAEKMAKVLGVSPLWLMGFNVDRYNGHDLKAPPAELLNVYVGKLSTLNEEGLKKALDYVDDLIACGRYDK